MKYHCTKRPFEDLSFEDNFYKVIKVINLGIPQLLYGIAAIYQIRYVEYVDMPHGKVPIYFLYQEDKGAEYWFCNIYCYLFRVFNQIN